MAKGKKGQHRQIVMFVYFVLCFFWSLCCLAVPCLSFCPLFPLVIVLYCCSLFVYCVLFFLWPLCCIADHCLSFCPFFPLVIVLYCWSLFVYFVLSFLWSLCCIADHCLSILSFFFLGHCAVLLITVCLFCPVISNTAQWPKEKKDKIDKQWTAIQHNDQRKKRTK
jgi:hypothetical protein